MLAHDPKCKSLRPSEPKVRQEALYAIARTARWFRRVYRGSGCSNEASNGEATRLLCAWSLVSAPVVMVVRRGAVKPASLCEACVSAPVSVWKCMRPAGMASVWIAGRRPTVANTVWGRLLPEGRPLCRPAILGAGIGVEMGRKELRTTVSQDRFRLMCVSSLFFARCYHFSVAVMFATNSTHKSHGHGAGCESTKMTHG